MLMTPYRKNPALRPSIPQERSGLAFSPYRPCRINGFSLVEVLVTIVILVVGLLGLAGLQSRALTAQMEAYQRSQALILLRDMASRVEANRSNAAAYITTTPRGTGFNSDAVLDCTALTGAGLDLCEWHNALLGAAETQGTNKVGAMIGARGCITQVSPGGVHVPGEYLIAVAWQGLNSTFVPAIPCGQGAYGTNDALRRVVALPISIPDLLTP